MTLGNEVKGQASVLHNDLEERLRDLLFSDSNNKKVPRYPVDYRHSIAAKNVLQQFILQKQALLTPFDLLKSNMESFKEFQADIELSQKEAESQLDYELAIILGEFDKFARKLHKHAVTQILCMVEKSYVNKYCDCTEVLQSALNASLKEGTAEVTASLSHKMGEYISCKIKYLDEAFFKLTKELMEQIYQHAAELFGLSWEGEIQRIPLKPFNIDSDSADEPIFSEVSPSPSYDNLPDSIINPLILKEIKMRVPMEMDNKYEVIYFYYQGCLRKAYWELKEKMMIMIEKTKNQIQSQLDTVVKQREDNHLNLTLKLNELEHYINELQEIALNKI